MVPVRRALRLVIDHKAEIVEADSARPVRSERLELLLTLRDLRQWICDELTVYFLADNPNRDLCASTPGKVHLFVCSLQKRKEVAFRH